MEIPVVPPTFGEATKTVNIPGYAAEVISRNLPLALHFDALIGQDLRVGTKGNTPLTDERKVKYLMFLAKTGQKHRSAQFAGVSQECVRQHEKKEPKFAEAIKEALEMFQEDLENEALRRAVDGWDEPVYQKGELVGHIHRKSERMMELLLKANLPEKYRENIKMDANVSGGVLLIPQPLSDAEWQQEYGGGPVVDSIAVEVPAVEGPTDES